MKCNFPSGANCVSILRIIKNEQSGERADKKYMTPIFINANDDEDYRAHMRCYSRAYNFCCDTANNINYEIIN